jgi:hypothetical protein
MGTIYYRFGSRVVIQVEFKRNEVTSRTRSALAAAEARGVKLGAAGSANLRRNIQSRQAAVNYFANKSSGVLAAFHADGLSQACDSPAAQCCGNRRAQRS